jgi:hypothetical protein
VQDIFQERSSWPQKVLGLAKSSEHADMTIDAVSGNKPQQLFNALSISVSSITRRSKLLLSEAGVLISKMTV